MSIGLLFWVLFVVALVFGGYLYMPRGPDGKYGPAGERLLWFVMLFLLGWRVFGFILHD